MTKNLERYLRAAHDAGCAKDQLDRFVSAGYIATESQLRFHAAARQADIRGNPTVIHMGGPRAAAKTHAAFAQVGIDDCQRVDGLKVLFLRNIKKAASESATDLVGRVLQNVRHKKTDDGIDYPNGSRVLIGGFKDERDIDKYLGLEYDEMLIEEPTLLHEKKLLEVRGSLRTSKSDWIPREYATWNPGGVGYAGIKKEIVEPWKKGIETSTRFFFMHWRDNPFINPEYITNYLLKLIGYLKKVWCDGDLDTSEGLAFPEFNRDRHVITPYQLDSNWPRTVGYDYGYNPDPYAMIWQARQLASSRLIWYREISQRLVTDIQQCMTLREMTPPDEHVSMYYAGHDCWAPRQRDTHATSTADEFAKRGIVLTHADLDHVNQMRKYHRILADLPDGKPGLQIFSTCAGIIDFFETLVLKPDSEDIADGQVDHLFRAGGYLLTNYKSIAEPVQSRPRQQSPLELMRQQGVL